MVNMNLKVARVKKEMSQYELSFKTGISQARISLMESGYRQPTRGQAERIAEALQVDTKELFTGLLDKCDQAQKQDADL
jgi:transcriptional regulator with XRE-family HTH domain